jgi:hypothetical protein
MSTELAGRDETVTMSGNTWVGLGPEFSFTGLPHVTLFPRLKKRKVWEHYVSANNWVETKYGVGRVVCHGKRIKQPKQGGVLGPCHSTKQVFTLMEYPNGELRDINPNHLNQVCSLHFSL